MVDIISKRDGPRREDVAAKRLIEKNRPTIARLADQLSGGGYSAMRQPPKPPEPDGLVFHDLAGTRPAESEHPDYVRISLNGRVALVDGGTSKQLHFIGEIRNGADGEIFFLATEQNKFFAPLDADIAKCLAELDQRPIDENFSEDDLSARISERLGLT